MQLLSRLLILAMALLVACGIALVQLAPGVFESQSDDSLLAAVVSESLIVSEALRADGAERESWAARLAANADVVDSFEPVVPPPAPPTGPTAPGSPAPQVATPVRLPPGAAFDAALRLAGDAGATGADAIILLDAAGSPLRAVSSDGRPIDASALVQAATAAAPSGDASVRSFFFAHENGVLAASLATVLGRNGENRGSFLLVQALDASAHARLQRLLSGRLYVFQDDAILLGTGDPSVDAGLRALLVRPSRGPLGEPGHVAAGEFLPEQTRTVALGLFSLGGSAAGYGIAVDGPATPSNLVQILVSAGIFDDLGTNEIMMLLFVALLLFGIILIMIDVEQTLPARRLADAIQREITSNDPAPVPPRLYPAHLRPIADAFNLYVNAHKHGPAAKRRKEQSGASHAVQDVVPKGERGLRDISTAIEPASPSQRASAEPTPARASPSGSVPSVGAPDRSPSGNLPAAEPAKRAPSGNLPAAEPAKRAPSGNLPAAEPAKRAPSGSLPAAEPAKRAPSGNLPAAEPAKRAPSGNLPAAEPKPAGADEAGAGAGRTMALSAGLVDAARSPKPEEGGGLTQRLAPVVMPPESAPPPAPEPGEFEEEQPTEIRRVKEAELLSTAEDRLRRLHEARASAPATDSTAGRAVSVSSEPLTPTPSPREEYRSLFERFQKTRAECGEPPDQLTYEKFLDRLMKNRDALLKQFSCRAVHFEVYVKNGKAALKATPIK